MLLLALPTFVRNGLTELVLLAMAFASLFFITGDDGAPEGHLFALLCTYAAAVIGGRLVAALQLKLPPLLGMLIAGFALRNLPYIGERVGEEILPDWSSAIRNMALALILCRAGLGMDVQALRKLRFVVARLSLLPCLTEATVIASLSIWLLDFPLAWGAMLGFIVAAVSPAVVVPSLLELQDQGYGVATGIPTMVVAAAALDDVFSIAGFGICLGFAIQDSSSEDTRWLDIVRAPLELVLGTLSGVVAAGILAVLLPAPPLDAGEEALRKDGVANQRLRATLLLFAALTASFGLKKADFSGASALAVLVCSGVVAHSWGPSASKPVAASFGEAWTKVAQPLLFGLVGAAVSVDSLKGETVAYGVCMLACSLVVRCFVTYLAVMGKGLRWQERLFTALAWMPKATVQAAVGAIALDEATNEEEEERGREVLAIAVLAIVCTAPIGAVIISITGPRFLIKEEKQPCKDEDSADLQKSQSPQEARAEAGEVETTPIEVAQHPVESLETKDTAEEAGESGSKCKL
mmetsp:Transcript_1387/g.3751  ORF Transcript_1387/g.3751 Transcript_1387/m.3751 type:complete len:522 (-) Transcript_1387:104-1669(-)